MSTEKVIVFVLVAFALGYFVKGHLVKMDDLEAAAKGNNAGEETAEED